MTPGSETLSLPDGGAAPSTTPPRWRAHYRTSEGRQRNKTFALKVDAERFLTMVESSKITGTFVDPSRARMTFGEMAAKWTDSKVALRPSTRAVYAAVMGDHVLPRWETTPLSAIAHEDVQAWVGQLVGLGISGAHVRKIFNVFSGVLSLAVRARRLPANPAAGIELPRATAKRKRYLTVAQVELLAEAAATPDPEQLFFRTDRSLGQNRVVVLVLAYCGLRWSEMAALRVGDIDLVKRRLTVERAVVEVDGYGLVWGAPKSHEVRWLAIPRFLAAELQPLVVGRERDTTLFTAPGGGVLRNRNARRSWFDRAARDAGVPG